MKKRVLLCVAAMMILMAGCAKEAKTVDVTALGETLLNDITYTDEMAQIDLETAEMIYYFGDATITTACIYEGSGATAEEIAIFECADATSADTVEGAVKERVEEQKESFESYVPEELVKLDAAVIVRNDNYVVLSVSGDAEQARQIIEDTF